MKGDDSIEKLEAWVHDSLNSNATPKEVYDKIVKTVEDRVRYYKESLSRSQNLLLMLKGNLSALYTLDTDPIAGKYDMGGLVSDSQAYVSSKVTEAKSEKEFRDFFKPSMDNFSTPEEGEEWVKDNGGYEYTPRKPFVPITDDDYSDIPHRY